jgi:bacitracin synthase 3
VKADRDASRNPLFDVMFAFNDFDIASPAAQNHVTVKLSPYRIKRQSSNFDLCLIAAESEGLFKFSLQYYSDIFEQSTIQSFVNCFLTISEMVSAKPDSPLSGIEIAAPAPIPVIHPTVKHEDPAMETIPGLFQKQAKQSPGSTAIIYNSQVINYQQLLNRSLAFAEAIDSRHIQKKSVIAIRAERGPEMISAMLGVMFAGCLYLPIDPQLSTERAAAIFKNADAAAAIILPGDGLADFATNTILIGTVPVKPTMAFQLTQVCGTDIAYVIYTSGSTGEPKGVAIQHQSIVNTLRWRMQYYHFNESDVTLQIPSYYFDSSVEDIFTTLISGGALVLTSERIFKDLDFFVEICTKNKVTNLLMIPSLYSEVLYRLKDAVNLSLRFVTLAGESIGENIVRRHFNIMPAVELYNEYGPTECSVCATVYRFSPTHTKVFIGKPITGIDCMVLNKDLNNCPAGIAGELYLSGIGLAKGYYNKPEETKSRFIQNIFGGGLMYATGDMVKRNADGNLEFLGRFDDQLKIRGYRIELQEIEHQIRQIAMVKEVVVVQQQAGNMLVGYFTAVEKISAERLKNVLEFKLPMYMIPASLIQLEEFPRTSNGKISRKALADRVIVRSEVNTKIKAVTELEKKLLYSWRGIVGIDSIGVLDNFFETGGNSINVLSFQHLINKEIGVLIPVDRFFQYANISRLAAFIAGQTQVLPLQHQPVSDLADTLDLFNQDV